MGVEEKAFISYILFGMEIKIAIYRNIVGFNIHHCYSTFGYIGKRNEISILKKPLHAHKY